MNFARTYLPTGSSPDAPSRFTGLGMVALVHALLIAGLVSGLQKQPGKAPPPPLKASLVDEARPKPQPVEKIQAHKPILLEPRLAALAPPELPPDIARTEAAPSLAPVADGASPVQAAITGTGTPAAEGSLARPARRVVVADGSVCTRMDRPEAPAMNWRGDALFRVLMTVKEGRVVATEIHAPRGGLDARSRRGLEAAIERTLRNGYECPGEHLLEQEFKFHFD